MSRSAQSFREAQVRALVAERLRTAAHTFDLSAEAQDLLAQMLRHDRHARPTVKEALYHPFNQASYKLESLDPRRLELFPYKEALEVRDSLPETLRTIAAEPMLKRVARLAIAHLGEVGVPENLAFRMLDRHGYGELSLSVLETNVALRGAECPADFVDVFEACDFNGDGYIGYLAFLSITLPAAVRANECLCKAA